MSPWTRWKKHVTEPIFPGLVVQLSRTSASGIRFSGIEKSLVAHFITPLPPGVLAPSFDRPNILDAKVLERVLRDGRSKLGGSGGDTSLLVPEMCVRVYVLNFDRLPTSPAEREELFRWRISKLVPLKAVETRLGYDVIKSNGQAKVVLALGVADVLAEYEAVSARAGLKVRSLSVPALLLSRLVRPDNPGNILIVSCEEDHVSLLALLSGELSLYRIKPLPAGGAGPMNAPWKRDQVIREIETTMNFIEDKEQKRITGLWIRPLAWPEGADTATDLRARWPTLEISSEFPGPEMLRASERHILAPLIGQVM
jgi:hypothetical protein